jgi:hypothetical protein
MENKNNYGIHGLWFLLVLAFVYGAGWMLVLLI